MTKVFVSYTGFVKYGQIKVSFKQRGRDSSAQSNKLKSQLTTYSFDPDFVIGVNCIIFWHAIGLRVYLD